MLQSFYASYGFFGSILLAFTGFMMFIFWFAGVSGIAQLPDSRSKTVKLIASVFVPVYPLFWLVYDMYYQREHMKDSHT